MTKTEIAEPGAATGIPSGLEGVAETLLLPLWARAEETRRPDGIIRDPMAVRILGQLDDDFQRFAKGWKSQTGIAIRTWLIDRAVSDYLDRHPDGAVVVLGCGLDARSIRLDNGLATWIDLDLPEVVALRQRLLPTLERRHAVGCSVLDRQWLDLVPVAASPLMIAEGLFMYLPEADLRPLMVDLATRFPGGEILIESLSLKSAGKTHRHDTVSKLNAKFVWGIDSGHEIEAWHPSIKLLAEWRYLDFHRRRWRWIRHLRWILSARPSIKLSHFRFDDRMVAGEAAA